MKIRRKENFTFVIFTLSHMFRLLTVQFGVRLLVGVAGQHDNLNYNIDLYWWIMDVAGEDFQSSNVEVIFSLTRTDWLVFFAYSYLTTLHHQDHKSKFTNQSRVYQCHQVTS